MLVDLDGTLSNGNHRLDYLRAKDWDGFHSRSGDDLPYEDTMLLIRRLSSFCEIVCFTARPEKWSPLTMGWINKHDVPIDHLYFRKADDYRPAQEVKVAQLIEHFGSLEEAAGRVWFSIEDNEKVAEAYRNAGISCWLVRSEGA